jgi:hypothetical protein
MIDGASRMRSRKPSTLTSASLPAGAGKQTFRDRRFGPSLCENSKIRSATRMMFLRLLRKLNALACGPLKQS